MAHVTPTVLRDHLTRRYPKLTTTVTADHARITLADDADIEGTEADVLVVSFTGAAGSFTERIAADQSVTGAARLLRMYADDLSDAC